LEEQATGHSGAVRLWMYELYEQAIQEDKQKAEQPVAPVVVKPARKVKITPRKARPAVVEHKPHYNPLPVFTRTPNVVADVLAQLAQLPVLNTKLPTRLKKITANIEATPKKRKRKEEEELLLLLAA
jgi:hypothetical protein